MLSLEEAWALYTGEKPIEEPLPEKNHNNDELKMKLKECFPGSEYFDLIDGLARAVFCLERSPHFAIFYENSEKLAVEKFFALCGYVEEY